MLGADCPRTSIRAGQDPPRRPQSRTREGRIPQNPEEEVVDASWGQTCVLLCACHQQPPLSALASRR